MAEHRTRAEQEAHDILAAEEFGVPAPDPALHRDEAHDILAAEEFGVPAPDPALHHGPIELPADPKAGGPSKRRALGAAGTVGALALLVRRRLRKRRA